MTGESVDHLQNMFIQFHQFNYFAKQKNKWSPYVEVIDGDWVNRRKAKTDYSFCVFFSLL